jgi:cytidylate kinase
VTKQQRKRVRTRATPTPKEVGAPGIQSRARRPARGERRIIAVDGPAGAGKSTAARALAARLGYLYVDSGAMYRAVGLAACERGVDPDDAAALATLVDGLDLVLCDDAAGGRVLLDGRDVSAAIRTTRAGEWASRVAAVPTVRERLVARQRALAARGGVVMDGRDVGTVIFPDADCKFFLTASLEERARRRQEDRGGDAAGGLAAARAAVEARDRRDRERTHAPLRPASDAVVLDTSRLAPEQVLERMLEVLAGGARP